jgi:hypothetical protein
MAYLVPGMTRLSLPMSCVFTTNHVVQENIEVTTRADGEEDDSFLVQSDEVRLKHTPPSKASAHAVHPQLRLGHDNHDSAPEM